VRSSLPMLAGVAVAAVGAGLSVLGGSAVVAIAFAARRPPSPR
jgi:hypothetical protein